MARAVLVVPGVGKLQLLNSQSFVGGSGVFNPDGKTKALRVVVVGGGGGGGAFIGDIPGFDGTGSGGGAGGVSIKVITGDALRDSYSYQVGAKGRGGVQTGPGSVPTNGGTSAFTADNITLHGAGGLGGVNAGASGNAGYQLGGWGGGFLGGDDNIRGDTGSLGVMSGVLPVGFAFGGASPVDDSRATTQAVNSDAPSATGYGGGGAPAIGDYHVEEWKGGDGGGGLIFVAEYG